MRISLSWGSVQPTRGGPVRLRRLRLADRRRPPRRASKCCRSSPARRDGRCRKSPCRARTAASRRRGSCRSAAARSAPAGSSSSSAAVQRYGPSGSFWAQNPAVPKLPIRDLAGLERGELQVLRRPAQPGRIRQAGQALLRGDQRRRPRRPHDPRRDVRAADRSHLQDAGRRRRTSPPTSSNRCTNGRRGSSRCSRASPCIPTPAPTSDLTPYIEEFRDALKANHDAGKALWITELGWSSEPPATERDGFAKGLGGQAAQLKGAFGLLRANQRKWHVQRVYWFSVGDLKGSCNFCDGSGLFGEGFKPKPAWHAFEAFARGN